MKNVLAIVLAGVFMLCSCPARAGMVKPSVSMQGTAANITFGITSTVSLTVLSTGSDTFHAAGSFDNQTLYGHFETTGRPIALSPDGHPTTLQFKGHLYVGDGDSSGFSADTRTDFTLSLWITGDGITGTYHIAELPSIDVHQYGTLSFPKGSSIPAR